MELQIKYGDSTLASISSGDVQLKTNKSYLSSDLSMELVNIPRAYAREVYTSVNPPRIVSLTKEFTGNIITNGYARPDGVSMIGNDRGMDPGIYIATYMLDDGYKWSDGTDSDISVTLTITGIGLEMDNFDFGDNRTAIQSFTIVNI